MIQLIFFLTVIIHALENALRRKRRLKRKDYRDIHKPTEVIIYSIASLIIGFIGFKFYNLAIYELIFLALLTRMAFFDIAFNIFSGRSLSYENPKGTSLIDRIEQVLPFWLRFTIYISLWILTILATMQNGFTTG